MTSNEVLAESIRNYLESGVDLLLTDDDYRTIIKALEQEPILDKIRSEIRDGLYGPEEMNETDTERAEAFNNGLNYCSDIIDKYKAESEDKE